MLIPAKPEHYERLKPLLEADAVRALFILGDIETHGLQCAFQETWVDHDEHGDHALVLRYHDSLVWYLFDELKDEDGLMRLIDDPRVSSTGCTLAHFQALSPALQARLKTRVTTLCHCPNLRPGNYTASRAIAEDATAILISMDTIEEFTAEIHEPFELRCTRFQNNLAQENSIVHIVKANDQVLAAASSTAHARLGAMIVGVFTLAEHRHQGHARNVVGSLIQTLLAQGRTPVLFFDNPHAGALYRDLGFLELDQWVMGSPVKRL
jgi:predicted GNAT family acetyltransferase